MEHAKAHGALILSGASCKDRLLGFKRPRLEQSEDSRLDEVTPRMNVERPKCQTQEEEDGRRLRYSYSKCRRMRGSDIFMNVNLLVGKKYFLLW